MISYFRFKASEREKIVVGRVVVVILVGVSLCWLPIIQGKCHYSLMVLGGQRHYDIQCNNSHILLANSSSDRMQPHATHYG